MSKNQQDDSLPKTLLGLPIEWTDEPANDQPIILEPFESYAHAKIRVNVRHEDQMEYWLKDPEFRVFYEKLAPKYQRIRQRIERKAARSERRQARRLAGQEKRNGRR